MVALQSSMKKTLTARMLPAVPRQANSKRDAALNRPAKAIAQGVWRVYDLGGLICEIWGRLCSAILKTFPAGWPFSNT
jgi:hypothetical protein